MPPATPDLDVLPVESVLPALRAALATRGLAVLQAPPGAGKTTRVPLALLDAPREGKLVVLEPRRVAARAAARRLAAQVGEQVGQTVGLTTRDERATSRRTRIEVVTDGVLLRRFQRDAGLADTGLLLFDEFHERRLEADLALAFALDTRVLRPDLQLLVASATLDGARVARLLGRDRPPAPVITATGRSHPVVVEHRDRPPTGALPEAVASVVVELLGVSDGHLLAFLPGAAEIRRTVRALERFGLPPGVQVLPLHGALPPAAQDAALAPTRAGRRKVVVATDLAESSVTIAGVTAVVDAGRSREPRFDPATGMSGLVTVAASQASADQRAGRAGRTGPGRCIRLWPAREHAARAAHPRPAITTDDLTGAALEVASWGAQVQELALLDPPPAAAWRRARQTLADLGALDAEGRVTPHGRDLVALPVHPRLGHLLVQARGAGDGSPDRRRGPVDLAVELVAVLGDRDLLVVPPEAPTSDLAARVRVLRGGAPPAGTTVRRDALHRARREVRRLRRLLHLDDRPAAASDLDRLGGLVATAWPERVAARRPDRRGTFVLAAGRGAQLPETDVLAGEPLLAVAHLDRGAQQARIHLAAPIAADELRRALADHLRTEEELTWRDGDVRAEEREVLGAVVLRRGPLRSPDPEALSAALLAGLRTEGLGLLAWTDDDQQLRARVALLRRELGAVWPDLSDEALLADPAAIAPFLGGVRRRADLARVRAGTILRARLRRDQLAALERLAPTHLAVPSGARLRLDYVARDRPVLAVRVQELFGSVRTPTIVDGRVPVLLELLSPARRPVQVTDDLAGFWERSYPQVRAELRGRYPKHRWPDDPRHAPAVRGTGRRR
jgi:ATP-dependent helicase HrpB